MATEYALSAERVESQFATNHLGPFLLTNLIMGKVLAARSPRVVMVASDGHRLSGIRFADYNFDVSGACSFVLL
jgi:NAD(P)-dependent dehydrogenase (short-subunit alcohol dehydrogenase family)